MHRPSLPTCLFVLGMIALSAAPVQAESPVPAPAEQLVCGFPAIAMVVNTLPPAAGRCIDGSQYDQPLFDTECEGCQERMLLGTGDVGLTPVVSQAPIPILPVGHPGFSLPIATIQGGSGGPSGTMYCVTVTPTGGAALQQCANLGNTPHPNLWLQPVTIGSIPEGGYGSTPAVEQARRSISVQIDIRSVDSRLSPRLSGLVNVWDPVDLTNPAEVDWWLNHGGETGARITLTLTATSADGGQSVQRVQHDVPFLGQVLAAQLRNAGRA